MRFAHFILPAILFAVCKAQSMGEFGYLSGFNVDANANQLLRNLELQQKREQLINQYRYLIVKSLLRLKDACRIYEIFEMNVDTNPFNDGQAERFSGEPVDIEQYIQTILNQFQSQEEEQIRAAFTQTNNTDPAINVLFYFVTTSVVLKDPKLDTLFSAMLHDQCCTSGRRRCSTDNSLPKRNNPPPKKARFHSWGGKRSVDMEKTTVVRRRHFNPWGGK